MGAITEVCFSMTVSASAFHSYGVCETLRPGDPFYCVTRVSLTVKDSLEMLPEASTIMRMSLGAVVLRMKSFSKFIPTNVTFSLTDGVSVPVEGNNKSDE